MPHRQVGVNPHPPAGFIREKIYCSKMDGGNTMKKFNRTLCILLSLIFIIQLMPGCASKHTDDSIYLTRGEFFAYFVHEYNMTSLEYTAEEIQNCDDGSVEADVLVEWEYLTKDQAKGNLKKAVDKETVVTVCARATFDLKNGDVGDIKDAGLLDDPQVIANAYASGLAELENGYFDGAKKMTLADCEAVLNKARTYAANTHYPKNTEKTETAEGVIEQKDEGYVDGSIVITLPEENENSEPVTKADGVAQRATDKGKITLLGTNTKSSYSVERINKNFGQFSGIGTRTFTAIIQRSYFEENLGNPKVGDTVIMNRFQVLADGRLNYGNIEIIGILREATLNGIMYECLFEYPDFEEAVEKKNVTESNYSGISVEDFNIEASEYCGWQLSFDVTDAGVKIGATKDFTIYETGRKQDWQNAKRTITATASFEMNDFNVDVNNLRSFAGKNGQGYIKITCNTDMSFGLSTSLRYTPDSNRNGKFPSNWNTSRWTDSDSKGATEIKVARFKPSFYGVAGADIYIYLQISIDGKASFHTSVEGGGMEMVANQGKMSVNKLGKKGTDTSANINLHGRLGVDTSLKIFGFIKVIEYDIGADLNGEGIVDLYYEENLNKAGVYADEEGLNEYRANDSKFAYCIGVQIDLAVSGELKESGVKLILKTVSKENALDFQYPIGSVGVHFEESGQVAECTRNSKGKAETVTASDDGDITLGTYKLNLSEGERGIVYLKSLPSETMNLLDSKNAITVKSSDKKIATVSYNKASKAIVVEAQNEGSTEIVIIAKKGYLWWKKTCEQKVSVTVSKTLAGEVTATSFVMLPFSASKI